MKYLAILLTMATCLTTQAQDWNLKKDRDGIKVWVRDAAGGSNLKESKARMVCDGTIDDFLEILLDFDNYVDWTPKAETGRLVEQVDDKTYYFYAEYKAPMVSNRDLVAKLTIEEHTNDKLHIVMTAVPDHLPEEKGLVRMPKYLGEYHVEKTTTGKLRITLQYLADPGGRVPDWMVNTTASDVPFELFQNLRDIL